jgi:hypothetical protein
MSGVSVVSSNIGRVAPSPRAGGGGASAWPIPDSGGLAASVVEVGNPTGVPFVFLHGLVGLN